MSAAGDSYSELQFSEISSFVLGNWKNRSFLSRFFSYRNLCRNARLHSRRLATPRAARPRHGGHLRCLPMSDRISFRAFLSLTSHDAAFYDDVSMGQTAFVGQVDNFPACITKCETTVGCTSFATTANGNAARPLCVVRTTPASPYKLIDPFTAFGYPRYFCFL